MLAAENEAIADTVLQRDAPLPAGLPRNRPRVRNRIFNRLRLDGDRAVAGQPVRVIVVPRLQRLLDQQATKARAIDEEVAFYTLARIHLQRRDVSALGILLDFVDLAFLADHTVLLRHLAQHLRVQ